MAVLVGHESFGRGGILNVHTGLFLVRADEVDRIGAVHIGAALLHRGGLLVETRERRPRLVVRALVRLLRHDLQHGHVLRALTDGGAEAVGTGVATTDDDDVLVLGGDVVHGLYAVHASGRVGQELHREVNALELAVGIFMSRGTVDPIATTTAS